VLEAPVEELAASGVAGLNLEAVARRAGVHKATLYRRWGTWERLVLELMREQAAETVPVPNTGSLRQVQYALTGYRTEMKLSRRVARFNKLINNRIQASTRGYCRRGRSSCTAADAPATSTEPRCWRLSATASWSSR
jgi:AcrR family transcriptional regulator